jgi:hypothetical protein
MTNFYEKLDSALVYGANKLVQTWNWTTGSTKATLGNCLVLTAPFFECYGYYKGVPEASAILMPASIILGLATSMMNFRQEREEIRVRDKMVKATYHYDKVNEGAGVISGLTGVGVSIPCGNENDIYWETVAIGNGLRSLSHCVMRADPVLPRKNCLSRGLDKLSEFVQGYRRREASVTIPAVGR